MKGFRPGKEPPQLRKKRAREQFPDAGGAQKRMIEIFAERTPQESRALLRRWRVGFLTGGLVAVVAAALLFAWSTVAGAVVGVVAIILLVIWWRLHSQREAFEALADTVGGGR